MNRFLLVALAVVSCIICRSHIAEAAGGWPPQRSYSYKGHYAQAEFDSGGPCAVVSAYVGLGESMTKSGRGRPADSAKVFVYLSSYDFCGDVYTFATGDAQLAPGEFGFSTGKSLDSAWVLKNLRVCKYDDQGFPTSDCSDVALDLDWTGIGTSSTGMSVYNYRSPGFRVSGRDRSTYRDATVGGSLVCGGVNLADAPWTYASLGYSSGGSVFISR